MNAAAWRIAVPFVLVLNAVAPPLASAACSGGVPNGSLEADEKCDDGDLVDGNCCRNDCTDPCDDGKECTADTCAAGAGGGRQCSHSKLPKDTPCESDHNP